MPAAAIITIHPNDLLLLLLLDRTAWFKREEIQGVSSRDGNRE